MEFQGRSQVLQGQELMELVAISPEDDAMRTVSARNSSNNATHFIIAAAMGSHAAAVVVCWIRRGSSCRTQRLMMCCVQHATWGQQS
jgi:hypothetical protein